MRITQKKLEHTVRCLNSILNRPMYRGIETDGVDEYEVGHLYLEKQPSGYSLMEVTSSFGCWSTDRPWVIGLSASEMNAHLNGITNGIALRNLHIGREVVKHTLEQAGITVDAALYSDALVDIVRNNKQLFTP